MRISTYFNRVAYSLRSPLIDVGSPEEVVLVAGMGRSGTTWAANVINHDHTHRVMFEPFFPARVKDARGFQYIQYLHPLSRNAMLAAKARRILSGKARNAWIDQANTGYFYRRRIVKDIRCNLMLGWLQMIAGAPPLVLVVRHPLQVALSWAKLGWGREALGNKTDFDHIVGQKQLLVDYPVIAETLKSIDRGSLLEVLVFQWAVFHLVPSRQLTPGTAYILYYESLLAEKDNEAEKLFRHLGRPFDPELIHRALSKPASTNFQNRDPRRDRARLLGSWAEEIPQRDKKRAGDILKMFGLDGIYDSKGYPTGEPFLKHDSSASLY